MNDTTYETYLENIFTIVGIYPVEIVYNDGSNIIKFNVIVSEADYYDTELTLKIEPSTDDTTIINPTDDITFSGVLSYTDESGDLQPISDAEIALYIDNEFITTTTTNENGEYSFNFKTTFNETDLAGGLLKVRLEFNSVEVVYSPEEYNGYTTASATDEFEVVRNQTSIEIDPYEDQEIYEYIEITGTLYDDQENPIPNQKLTVTINGVEYSEEVWTNETGRFSIKFTDTTAEYDIVIIRFEGDEKYISSFNVTFADFEKIETDLHPDYRDYSNVHVGETITISGQLEDAHEYDISYDYIYISDGINVYKVQTDANGNYSFNYTVTSTETTSLTIYYPGNDDYFKSTEVEITLDVEQSETELTISANNALIREDVTITGTLYDIYGNPIDGEYVSIVITDKDGITVDTIDNVPVTNGVYSTTTQFDKADTYTATVTFAGSDDYLVADSQSTEFTISEIPVSITIDQIETTADDRVSIGGSVTAENGDSLEGKSVQITITDSEGNTVAEGSAEIGYDGMYSYTTDTEITTPGDYNVVVTFTDENGQYLTDSQTSQFNIDKLKSELTITDTTSDLEQHQATTIFELTSGDEVISTAIQTDFTVTLNGKELDQDDYTIRYDETNQNYVLTYNIDSAGYYYVTVTYNGDDTYTSSEDSYDFTVTQKTATIEITGVPTISKVGQEITATITVNNIDSPSKDNLKVTVNDDPISITNIEEISEGVYSIKFTPNTDGKYTIIATYDDTTGTYDVISGSASVKVEKIKTEVTITSIDPNDTDNVVITGTLTGDGILISGTVSISINGEQPENCDVKEGTFTYTYHQSVYGTNTVEVHFTETNMYTSSYATDRYMIDDPNAKTDTTITVSDIADITLGESVTITGSLTYGNNIPIGSAQIIITINGKDYTTTTNQNGIYTLTPIYTPTTTGNYTVVVQYDGDTTYNPNHTSTTFNVNKDVPTITVEHTDDIKINDSVTITGVLSDENGALANKQVTIIINDQTYYNTTDSNGRYSYNYTPESTGSYSVLVEYPESDTNKETHAATAFYTDKLETTITVYNATGYEGETVNLTATVVDERGNPVSEGKVAFKLNDVTLVDEKGEIIYVDVIDGVATLPYTITNHAANYTITGLYYGSDNYYTSKSEDYGTLEVKKTSMNTRVLVNDTTAQYGDTIELAALVLDEDGNIVTSGKVVFKLNGVSLKDENGDVIYVTIGEDGYARLTYTITNNPKLYTVTAVYSGDGYYITSRNTTATLNVTNRVVGITVDSASGKSGDTITLKATITEDDNTYTDNGVVVFKLNGVTIRDENGDSIKVNVVDGVAELEYEIPVDMAGKEYNLTAVYSNKNYDRAEANNTLTVERSEVKTSITPLTTTKGSDTTISTVLYDENGNQLERSTKVAIKINGKTVVHTTTENGVLNVTIPTEELSKGNYNIEVVFGENSAYYEKRLNTTLTIV